MREEIYVRPARPRDIAAVSAILVEGFRDKFKAAFRGRLDRAERILQRTFELESAQGLPGLYVAELDDQVVGTLAIRRRGQTEVPFGPSTVILFEELGLWGGLRAMVYLSLLDQSCSWHEAYVSDVAVAAPYRRRGVGQALLLYVEGVARRWGKRTLILDVSAQNEAARRLYRRLGYVEKRVYRSLLTSWLLRIHQWVRMSKEVS